jgi:Ca-activated chloride channel family protein
MDGFNFEEPTTKVVVVITDGENTEGDAFAAATDAGAKGVRLYTIGMGSPAGAPIPIYDASGRQSDFKRDRSGNVVVTKLGETGLQRIADLGSGAYYRATGSQDELNAIYESINALQKREFGVSKITDYEDRFQYFLGAAILFLLAELLVSERKSAWIARLGILRAKEEAQ